MVNPGFIKNDSYEKGPDSLVVLVYLQEICRDISAVLFCKQDLTLISPYPNLCKTDLQTRIYILIINLSPTRIKMATEYICTKKILNLHDFTDKL